MTTLCAVFQKTAAANTDRVALRTIDGAHELTWGAYRERVHSIAAGLAELGVGPGDTVALMMVNRPEFHLIDTAVLHLGATPFSIYNTLTADQISGVCANAEARVLITEPQFLPQVRTAQPDTKIEHIVLVEGSAADCRTLEDVESAGDPGFDLETLWRSVRPEDIATIVYTSGTTGPPKGVELTHRSLLALLTSFVETLGVPLGPGDRTLSFLPAAHLAERFGFHYLQLAHGTTITSCPDIKQVTAALADVRPTYFGAVPRVWEKAMAAIEARIATEPPAKRVLLTQALELSKRRVRAQQHGDDIDPASRLLLAVADRLVFSGLRRSLGLGECKMILLGGALTPPDVLEFFAAIGIWLTEVYGMTETSGFITTNPPRGQRFGTVGRAVTGVELRLADDGELLVRGECLMRGYRSEPAKTAATFNSEGWLCTGDIATIDSDGYVRIVDRKKELIINAAGKNMSPLNIEAALKMASPLIEHAVAIGDGRPYNVALLVIDPDAKAAYLERTGHHDVTSALDAAVATANNQLARVEQIKKFTVLEADWQPGSDELTPKGSLKRKSIAAKYADRINALYGTEGVAQ